MLEEILLILSKKNISGRINILELGPGLSSTSKEVSTTFGAKTVTILDWSDEVLRIQKKRLLKVCDSVKLYKVDLSDPDALLKLKIPQQDLIICTEVLEHVADERKVVDFIRNHLTQRGLAVFSVPSKKSERVFHLINKDYMVDKTGHVREFDEKTIRDLMNGQGMKIVEFKKVCSDFFIGNFFLFLFRVQIDENTGEILNSNSIGAKASDWAFRIFRKLRLTRLMNPVINRNYLFLAEKIR